jgi:hypothetical protein
VQHTENVTGRLKLKDAERNETKANGGVTDMEKDVMKKEEITQTM